MTDLSPRTRQILLKARAARMPTAADRDRIRAGLAARLEAPPRRRSVGATVTKIAVPILVAAAATAAAATWWTTGPSSPTARSHRPDDATTRESSTPEPVSPPAAATPPAEDEGGAPPSDVDDRQEPAARAAARPHRAGRHAPTTRAASEAPASDAPVVAAADTADVVEAAVASPPPVSPLEEAAFISRAIRLTPSDAPGALTVLDQYARRFPEGQLRSEAMAARIDVLCALHRTADARALVRTFLREYPRSPAVPRVRSACGAR